MDNISDKYVGTNKKEQINMNVRIQTFIIILLVIILQNIFYAYLFIFYFISFHFAI